MSEGKQKQKAEAVHLATNHIPSDRGLVEFSQRLLALRESLGMSRKDFSTSVGVAESGLSTYERGKIKPGLDVLVRICRVFGADANWLLLGEGSEPTATQPSWTAAALVRSVSAPDGTQRITLSFTRPVDAFVAPASGPDNQAPDQ